MANSSYVAWDGNKYGGEPPEGWYLAADSRWWPQGYAPSAAEVESAKAAPNAPGYPDGEVTTVPGGTVADVVPGSDGPTSDEPAPTGFGSSFVADSPVVDGVSRDLSSGSNLNETDGLSVPDVSGLSVPDVSVPDVNVPDVSVPDVNVPDVNVSDVSGLSVPDVSVPDVSDVSVPDVSVSDVSVPDVSVPDVSVPDVPDVGVPDVSGLSLPGVGVPGAQDGGPTTGVSNPEQFGKPDFGGLGSNESAFGGLERGMANNQPVVDDLSLPGEVAPLGTSEAANFGTYGSEGTAVASSVPQAANVAQAGAVMPDHGVAFPDTSSKPAPVSLPASSEPTGTGTGAMGSTGSFTAYSKSAEPEKKSRKLLWIGLLALLLLAVVAAVAWAVLRSQGDDAEAVAEIDETSENVGSFNAPQEFDEALNIYYVDEATVRFSWIIHVVGAGSEVAELKTDPGQTLTAATLKVEYEEGVEGTTLEHLMFASIGSDRKSTEIDQDCTASLSDGIDITTQLSPGDTVEGQFCWAVPEDLAKDQVLEVSSPEANGEIYFELK